MVPSTVTILFLLLSMAGVDGRRYSREILRGNHELGGMNETIQENSTPEFEDSIVNRLSVIEGKDAQLDCTVRNLGSYEVSWYHIDKQLLLTSQNKIKISNPRIKVVGDERIFTLFISSIKMEDSGYYACRINTRPPKSQVKFLEVVVEPRFVDFSTKSETTLIVKENDNASLSCKAIASPPPVVKWKREDGRPIILSPFSKSQDTVTGDELVLTQISRWMSGSFICTVTSGISVPISRRITLVVHFPPLIMIPSQVITIGIGFSVNLECHTESHPLAQQEWVGPDGEKIVSNSKNLWKFSTTAHKVYSFKIIYKLTIFQVEQSDSGRYTCVAKNKLGMTKSSLTLQVTEDLKRPASSSIPDFHQSMATAPNTSISDIYMKSSDLSDNLNFSNGSSDEEKKPLEVFIDLANPLRNKTKNIWAHFTTSSATINSPPFYTMLSFILILLQLHTLVY